MLTLILVAFFSLAIVLMMVSLRLSAIRSGRVIVLSQSPLFFSILQKKIDWLAVVFVLLFREGLKFVFLKILFFLKKIALSVRNGSIKIEKRFSHIIDLVHGKGSTNKKGAVSFFLREIKDHNDKIKINPGS